RQSGDLAGYRSAANGEPRMDDLLRMIQQDEIDLVVPHIGHYGLTGLRRLAYSCWLFGVRGAVACSASKISIAAALTAAAGFAPRTKAIPRPGLSLISPPIPGASLPTPAGPGLGLESQT